MAVTINDLGLLSPRSAAEVIHRPTPGAVTKGLLGVLGNTIGFWLEDNLIGVTAAFCTKAEWAKLTCATAPTAGYLQGAIAYYDSGSNVITGTSGGNTACGRFRATAVAGSTTCEINFTGGTAA